MNTQQTYQDLALKISVLRRRIHQLEFQTGFIRLVLFAAGIGIVGAVLEMLYATTVTHRWILLICMSLALLLSLIYFIAIPALRLLGILPTLSSYDLATMVGRRFPEIKDRLANALQIFETQSEHPYSSSLVQSALESVGTACNSLDFTLAADHSNLRRWSKRTAMGLSVMAVVCLAWLEPVTGAFARILDPRHSVKTINVLWDIQPGNVRVLQGDTVNVRVKCILDSQAVHPDPIRLLWWPAGVETASEELLTPDGTEFFKLQLPNVRQNLRYAIEGVFPDGPRRHVIRSSDYDVDVVKRPAVKSFSVEIIPPDYTHAPARLQETNIGDITAIRGSRVRLKLEATKSLETAQVVFSDSTFRSMNIGKFNTAKADVEWVVTKDGVYHLALRDTDGAGSAQPVDYRMTVIADESPLVKMTAPINDVDVNDQMILPLSAEVQDDFGITKLLLHYRLEKTNSLIVMDSSGSIDVSFLLDPSGLAQQVAYTWSYQSLRLQPEDVVSFFFEVYDNDPISGPKRGRSDVRRLRFPSLEEILKEVDQKQDETIAKAEETVRESEEMKKELEEINRDLLKDKKLEWKDKEKLKELTRKHEEIRKNIEEMQKALEDVNRKMQDNKLMSPETMQKYEELQKLMSEINTPEFQDAMRKLQQAMQNNFDPQQLKEAMKDLKFSQENFKQNVERTLELMKRIKAEQMFDQLAKQSEELSQRQELLDSLSHHIRNENERQALTKEQEDIRRSTDQMKHRGEELEKLLQELDKNQPNSSLGQSMDRLKKGDLQKKMGQNRSSIQQGSQSSPENKDNQEHIERALDSLSQEMKNARDEYREQNDRKIMNAMRKVIFDMVEISKTQEGVMTSTAGMSPAHPRFYLSAQAQADVLSNMSKVTESMLRLSNQSFYITGAVGKVVAGALNSMDQAIRDLEQRNAFQASLKQQNAMMAVNEAVKMLMKSVDAMNQGHSGTGLDQLMEELQQMAGQQGSLNDQTIPFGRNPGSLTPEQQAALGRIMAEQQALKQSMENAQQAAQDQKDLQGQLGNIAKEMEDVIKDMQEQKVDRRTLERQQRILQKLLDASRSSRERDLSEKRKGETGKDYHTKSPGELPADLTERKNKLRQNLLNELKQGYSKDYEDLIRRYFEALGELPIAD